MACEIVRRDFLIYSFSFNWQLLIGIFLVTFCIYRNSSVPNSCRLRRGGKEGSWGLPVPRTGFPLLKS